MTDLFVVITQTFWGICEFAIYKKMRADDQKADKKSYKVLYVVTLLSLLLGISVGILLRFDNIYNLYHPSVVFPLVGGSFVIAGLVIRLSAIATLKNYFTVNVTIMDDHKLITDGLYQYIRHPAYAGGILSFIGCGIAYGNIISFVLISLPYFIFILRRIKYEETLLIGKFGQDYLDLIAKTKKLIPYIY